MNRELDIDQAAQLNVINELKCWTPTSICGPGDLAQDSRHVADLKVWAASIDDNVVRDSYLHWLTFYGESLARKEAEVFRAGRAMSENQRIEEIAKRLPRPGKKP